MFVLASTLSFFFLMIRRPPRSTPLYSSAASDVYKRQFEYWGEPLRSIDNFLCLLLLVVAFGVGISLSLIHISEPTRHLRTSYAVFCLKTKHRSVQTAHAKATFDNANHHVHASLPTRATTTQLD